MTALKLALEPLRLEYVPGLLRSPGPCLTLRMPPYRPGAQSESTAVLLSTYIQNAEQGLRDRKIPDFVITALLDPLRELGKDSELSGGSHWGRVIFRSPEVFRQFGLIEPAGSALTIGDCFELRPILAQLHLPPIFYFLKLSKERVGLLRCSDLRVEAVELPRGVPTTLEELLSSEPPDHNLENRSSAGSSVGAMRGVLFGTGSGRETQHAHLRDFYKAVDWGLHKLLPDGKAPVALVGVDEHASMYHAVSSYPNLLGQSIHGTPESFQEVDLVRRGVAIIRAAGMARAARELVEGRERLTPSRFSLDMDTILPAAIEGRVDRLYIGESASREGVVESAIEGKYQIGGNEDLLNRGVIETIRRGGQAFAVSDDAIPDGAAAAAIFRF